MNKDTFKKVMKYVAWIPLWFYVAYFWFSVIKGMITGFSGGLSTPL